MRLTITRAVSGFSGEPSHAAKALRRPEVRPCGGGISVGGVPDVPVGFVTRMASNGVGVSWAPDYSHGQRVGYVLERATCRVILAREALPQGQSAVNGH